MLNLGTGLSHSDGAEGARRVQRSAARSVSSLSLAITPHVAPAPPPLPRNDPRYTRHTYCPQFSSRQVRPHTHQRVPRDGAKGRIAIVPRKGVAEVASTQKRVMVAARVPVAQRLVVALEGYRGDAEGEGTEPQDSCQEALGRLEHSLVITPAFGISFVTRPFVGRACHPDTAPTHNIEDQYHPRVW
jgi:hypothetical protein